MVIEVMRRGVLIVMMMVVVGRRAGVTMVVMGDGKDDSNDDHWALLSLVLFLQISTTVCHITSLIDFEDLRDIVPIIQLHQENLVQHLTNLYQKQV